MADVAVTCLVPQGTENAESKVNEQNDRGRTTSRGTFAKRVLKSTVGAAAVAAKGKRSCTMQPGCVAHCSREDALTCSSIASFS